MDDIVERHRCEDSECPYFRQPSPDKCGCHKTREQMADALIVELKADNTYLAETLLEMGKNVVLFVDEFEDEGDRVYFGSTNHADYLRELRQKIDEVWYDQERVDEASSGRDLYAEMAALRAELVASREREAKLAEALDDVIATIAAVRATASGDRDDWADSAKHFYQVCGMSMATCSAALAKHREAQP